MNPEASDDQIQIISDTVVGMLEKCEQRFGDNREYVAGAHLTYADFQFLAHYTSLIDNEAGGKHAKVKETSKAKLENCPNVKRVVDKLKALENLPAYIEAMEPTSL